MKQWLLDLRPAAALSLAGCFLVALYAPLELYFTNMDEFYFGFSELFPVLLKLFALGFPLCLAGFAVCYAVYQRLYDAVLCAGAAGFLCTYIQGMFLAGKLPAMDGTPIRWEQYGMQDLQSVALWLIVGLGLALAARFLHRRGIYRLITGLSLFLTAVLLVTGLTVGVMNQGFAPKPQTLMSVDGEFTMSTEQNLVVFVVDATDSRTFTKLLESQDPEFADILEDFTYYPNTVSAYPFTKCAIPNILHGQWYENQEDFHTFTRRAMEQSPLLTELRDRDYRVGIYEEETYLVSGSNLTGVENTRQFHFAFTSGREVAKAEMRLVWFKYAPWPLKKYLPADMEQFSRLLRLPEGVVQFHDEDPEFYQAVLTEPVETVPEKCFRFYHIEGSHKPFRYDKDVNLIEDGTYEQNVECTMTIVKAYLQKLREAGVYDNTAVVLLADHGYGNDRDVAILGRCNPLLAVKGVGERHPMETSQAPVSYEDLQEMYRRLLDGADSTAVFDAQEGDQRSRRVLMYYFRDPDYMAEYMQTGHAFDLETLQPTGREYRR